MSEADRPAAGAAFRQSLAALPESLPGGPYAGRGIVICAGGLRMFTNAWVLISVLRKTLGCELPIEVWHLGPQEMSSGMRGMLAGLGARVVDAFAAFERFPADIADGWQLKPYALIMSSFREVLLLDADNLPVTDPAVLFDRPEYKETGALFWPDVLDIAATNPIWAECGLPAEQRPSWETGQAVVDKARHGRALMATLRLNEDADRFYKLIYGDKDTFLVGWLATASGCTVIPHRPHLDRYFLFQRDFDGGVLFQHRSNAKWTYSGPQIRSAALLHQDACEAALAKLRRIWNGRIFEPPPRSLAARRLETLTEGRAFTASLPGEDDRPLELLPGGQIGHGRDIDRETWFIGEPEPERFVLHLLDRHAIRHRLRQDGDCWAEALYPEGGLRLAPAEAVGCSGNIEPRDLGFVRELVEAVLIRNSWTEAAATELRVTFGALSKADPRLIDDLAAYTATDAEQLGPAARDGLLAIATALKATTVPTPQRRGVEMPVASITDRNLYAKP